MSNEQEGWEPWRPMRPTLAIRSPVPLKPPPLSRMNHEPGDIVSPSNTKQEHSNFCHELRARSGGFYNAGPLRRVCTAHRREAALDHHFFPARSGASNRGEAAADPSLDYIFVNSSKEASIGWMRRSQKDRPCCLTATASGRCRASTGAKAIRALARFHIPVNSVALPGTAVGEIDRG